MFGRCPASLQKRVAFPVAKESDALAIRFRESPDTLPEHWIAFDPFPFAGGDGQRMGKGRQVTVDRSAAPQGSIFTFPAPNLLPVELVAVLCDQCRGKIGQVIGSDPARPASHVKPAAAFVYLGPVGDRLLDVAIGKSSDRVPPRLIGLEVLAIPDGLNSLITPAVRFG